MSQTKDATSPKPRAMVHRRILDAARERPNASTEELSDSISGASVELVEQVLDEYGDPGEEATESPAGDLQPPSVDEPQPGIDQEADQPPADSAEEESAEAEAQESPAEDQDEATPDPDTANLSEVQRETLQAIQDDPSATQSEIGDVLGVSAATVSRRLSKISGFAWEARRKFVEELFDTPAIGDGRDQLRDDSLERFEYRLKAIERQLDMDNLEPDRVEIDLELAHKVIHACMNSGDISVEEELEVIRALLGE